MIQLDERLLSEGVAIVGRAARFPKSASIQEFWRRLRDGEDCISFFSLDEILCSGVSLSSVARPSYVAARGIVDGIDCFDAALLGFTPREAEILDPQFRVFLECAWTALEDAGHDPGRFCGRIGVFVGSGMNGYALNLYSNPAVIGSLSGFQFRILSDKDFLPTWVSHKLNLTGPSIAIQSGCSTSLVAVHMACMSLLNGESDLALAGGVTLNVPQTAGYVFADGGIGSADGHCRAFDEEASGCVSADGAGVVVLRRLEDALLDGDLVHSVVISSAVNNDGADKIGYTAPSVSGQARVIREALAAGDVRPDEISYIEAHGTATRLGDPIEISALSQAFRSGSRRNGFCHIGSVKTNIGHADAAAGIAGLLKVSEALEHGEIPASLHFKSPNAQIDFDHTPFVVNRTRTPWKASGSRRTAGVSSFGIGGTNAHVVLQEAPPREPSMASRPDHLLALSAKSLPALEKLTDELATWLRANPDSNIADVAYTLHVGRRPLEIRRVLVCSDASSAVEAIESRSERLVTARLKPRTPPLGFLLPGELMDPTPTLAGVYDSEPIFRDSIAACWQALPRHTSLTWRDCFLRLIARDSQVPVTHGLCHMALFAAQYALAQLWLHWGVHPEYVLGFGAGECVAACLSGACSLTDALKLAALRGGLCQDAPLETSLEPIFALPPITVTENGLNELRRGLTGIPWRVPELLFVSSATGSGITAKELSDPHYWVRSAVQPSLETLFRFLTDYSRITVEMGAASGIARFRPSFTPEVIAPAPAGHESVSSALLEALGRVWTLGIDVEWSTFYAGQRRSRVSLPTYPFERKRYWVDAPDRPGAECAPLDQTAPANALYVQCWKTESRSPQAATQTDPSWLIFQNGLPAATRFAPAREFTRVTPGPEFRKLAHREYTVRQDSDTDYDALFLELSHAPGPPTGVAILGPDCAADDPSLPLLSMVLRVIGALERAQNPASVVVIVSFSAVKPSPDSVPQSIQSFAIRGLIEALRRQNSGPRVRLVEFDSLDLIRDPEGSASLVAAELNPRDDRTFVAYRGGRRWVQEARPVPIESTASARAPHPESTATQLVTGDLGHHAAPILYSIAQGSAANIVVLGQRDLSDPPTTAFQLDEAASSLSDKEARIQESLQIKDLPAFPGLEGCLHRLAISYLHRYVGAAASPGKTCLRTELRRRLRLLPKFDRLLDFVVRELENAGVVSTVGGQEITLLAVPPSPEEIERLQIESHRLFPEFRGVLDLLQHCADQYSAALSGEIDALGVVYHSGSVERLRRAAGDTVEFGRQRRYALVLGEILKSYAAHARSRIRILEIGAGNGSLTNLLMPQLSDINAEYWVTDIGRSFVTRAKAAAREHREVSMRFEIIDIAKDIVQQGLKHASFDIVVGLNVVHAAPDVAQALSNLRAVLSGNGLLCLIETVKDYAWAHMIMGLTTEWWHFDDAYRTNSPLLSVESWLAALHTAGFSKLYSAPARTIPEADCALLLAQQESPVPIGLPEFPGLQERILYRTAEGSDELELCKVEQETGPITGMLHFFARPPSFSSARTVADRIQVIRDHVQRSMNAACLLAARGANRPLDLRMLVSVVDGDWSMLERSACLAAAEAVKAVGRAEMRAGRPWIDITACLGSAEGSAAVSASLIAQVLTTRHVNDTFKRASFELWAGFAKPHQPQPPLDSSAADDSAPLSPFRLDASATITSQRTGTERTIAAIWEEAFGISGIDVHEDFEKLGGDSLLALEINAKINERLSVNLPLAQFMAARSIAGCAEATEQCRNCATTNPDTASGDWHADTILEADINIPAGKVYAALAPQSSKILLTGATGFLGAYLLSELLEQTTADVLCLVRSHASGGARIEANLRQYGLWNDSWSSRIEPWTGDLEDGGLSIARSGFERVKTEVGAIYHCAAVVNFAYDYQSLRRVNVLGVKTMLRLATQQSPKPIHFVSSFGIFPPFDRAEAALIAEAEEASGREAHLATGYAKTKWVAEKIIFRAIERGIPGWIYRPGIIAGDSRSGICNTRDLFARVLIACVRLGAVPLIQVPLDLIPVEYAAQAIVRLSLQPVEQRRVFHLLNPVPLSWHDVAVGLNAAGYRLQTMAAHQWLEALAQNDEDGIFRFVLGPLLRSTALSAVRPDTPSSGIRFSVENTVAGLVGSGVSCPRLDAETIRKYVSHLVASGELEAHAIHAN